ncbi:MAG: hypothetical protein L3J24_07590 [Xanthomonadales bacterium]|nr:hypothetical protein [Xanthomonadales bacterium]
MKKTQFVAFFALSFLFLSTSALAGWDANLEEKARGTITSFQKTDSSLESFFDKAYAYAVFPKIGKGGLGIGGAHGTGVVFKGGKAVGKSKMTQLTIGFQAGGQAYKQIIFFQNKKAYDAFVGTNYEFSANVSAVALKLGAAAQAAYSNGVAIFTLVTGGLMYEASLGGQQYRFHERDL